jgi:hypothetical protein
MTKHPLFTKAKGRGSALIEIHIVPLDSARFPTREGILLARLDGADIDLRTTEGHWSVASIDVPHLDATDFEHDTAHLARIEVAGLTLLSLYGGETRYAGTLVEARLYPQDVDPLTVGDADTEPEQCDGTSPMWNNETNIWDTRKTHDPHPLMAYLPPARDELDALCPSVVTITVRPRKGKK